MKDINLIAAELTDFNSVTDKIEVSYPYSNPYKNLTLDNNQIIMPREVKDGKTKRRDRREMERKNKKQK